MNAYLAQLSELEAILRRAERRRLRRLLQRTPAWTSIHAFRSSWTGGYHTSSEETELALQCLYSLGIIEMRNNFTEVRAAADFERIFSNLLD